MNFLKMMTMIKKLAVLAMTLIFAQPLFAGTLDEIVAVVNEEVITQREVNRFLAVIKSEYKDANETLPEGFEDNIAQARKSIINQMIEERLILSEARKSGIEADEARINARIEQVKEKFPSEKAFENSLQSQRFTLKDLRRRFSEQEIMKEAVDYFVRSKIKIDPIEVSLFYKAHKKELSHPEKALVKTIFIRIDDKQNERQALKKAGAVLEKLRKGKNFEELVRRYSQGTNVEEDGSIGYVEKGQLLKGVDETIFRLKPGEFSDVIKTPQGFRIFKVEEKKPAKPLAFSEAQDIIRKRLYDEKFAGGFKKWVAKLKKDAYIKVEGE
jgi:parvulin-like peptidyl-prolyl isomerase